MERRFAEFVSAVWLTYGPGQMLIVYSTARALGRKPQIALGA
jgi:hypothetical protein